jgi:hypothetical protein
LLPRSTARKPPGSQRDSFAVSLVCIHDQCCRSRPADDLQHAGRVL